MKTNRSRRILAFGRPGPGALFCSFSALLVEPRPWKQRVEDRLLALQLHRDLENAALDVEGAARSLAAPLEIAFDQDLLALRLQAADRRARVREHDVRRGRQPREIEKALRPWGETLLPDEGQQRPP